MAALDQQRAGAARRVADPLARLGRHQLRQQRRDLGRGVELAGLLARARGELADQELVGVADDVPVADAGGPQVELGVGEVVQQVLQALVALFGAPQRGLGVEVDVAEDAFQLLLVGVLDGFQRHVDDFAQVGRVALGVERGEIGAFGQLKLLETHAPADARLVVAELRPVGVVVVAPYVGDVLDEQHHQDVVLVLGRVHRAAKGVARPPQDGVDLVLADLTVQWIVSFGGSLGQEV